LIDDIQDDLDTSHALAGLLGTIPVLCMGLFAPVAASLAAWLGTRRAMTIGLTLIGAFGVLRAVVPSAWLVVLLTVPVGIGMGLGNALSPLIVRKTVPKRPGTGTGVYTTGIQLGSTLSAALAVPLAAVLGGWRGALIALSVAACVVALAWTVLERGGPEHRREQPLVPRYRADRGQRGCSSRSSRCWARRTTASTHGCQTPTVSVMSVVFATGAIGLVALPAGGYAWALLAGIAHGGMFALVMTLPHELEEGPERVGALVALMLGFGYSLAAVSPFALGGVRDLTGSFDAVLWVCARFLVLLVGVVDVLRRRVVHAN
jgi:CP family cyanate transporter-like MFS transporter